MKKYIFLFILTIFLSAGSEGLAKPHSRHEPPPPPPPHYHHNSYARIIKTDFIDNYDSFANCQEHLLLTTTIVNYYSDGRILSSHKYAITNKNGNLLADNCSNIQHIIYNNRHYFILKQSKKYKILNSYGELISARKYKSLTLIAPNRVLGRSDGKFGIIDLNENIITPFKYKTFEAIGNNIFLTKLNGYYGIMDSENNTLIKNEYDSISRLHDTFVINKLGKYGLIDKNGHIILEDKYDDIKEYKEYILVKEGKKYGVFDSSGKQLSEIKYKKIKLNRNQLEGKLENNTWVKL